MNWLTNIMKLLPYILAGVNVIHSDASDETKSQIATQLLGVAVAGATQSGVLSPTNSAIAAGAGDVVQGIITSVSVTSPTPAVSTPASTPKSTVS